MRILSGCGRIAFYREGHSGRKVRIERCIESSELREVRTSHIDEQGVWVVISGRQPQGPCPASSRRRTTHPWCQARAGSTLQSRHRSTSKHPPPAYDEEISVVQPQRRCRVARGRRYARPRDRTPSRSHPHLGHLPTRVSIRLASIRGGPRSQVAPLHQCVSTRVTAHDGGGFDGPGNTIVAHHERDVAA